jgi:Protein of unknown function (DUF2793).
MSKTKRIGLEYLEVNQSQKEVTVNEALNKLDAFVGLTVKGIVTSLPSSADEGTAYLYENDIVQYLNDAWETYAPFEGLRLYVLTTGLEYRFLSGTWQQITVPNIQVVDALPSSPLAGTVYFIKETEA